MKKLLALALTVLVLAVLYTRIDARAMLAHLRGMRLGVFFLALLFFLPQVWVTAVRWCWMVADLLRMGTLESARLILAGKALNALLPSKLGETSKAFFLKAHAGVALPDGVALVLLEKVLDVAGLCVMLLAGLAFTMRWGTIETVSLGAGTGAIAVTVLIFTQNTAWMRGWLAGKPGIAARIHSLLESWDTILSQWKRERARLAGILLLSVALWFLHLAQIALFFLALRSEVPFRAIFAYVPVSIFIGLLPITIGGMGTRDSALIVLFAPWENAAVMAGVGILCSLRYWLDTLAGLPFFHAYSFNKKAV
jgi:hypothetical protein